MKAKHLFTTLLLSFFFLSLTAVSYAQSGTPKKANEAEVTFISDLDCPNCQKKVEAKLPFEKGVKDLKVDLEKTEIWILYQTDKTDVDKLIAAIAKLGHTAVVKTDTKDNDKK